MALPILSLVLRNYPGGTLVALERPFLLPTVSGTLFLGSIRRWANLDGLLATQWSNSVP